MLYTCFRLPQVAILLSELALAAVLILNARRRATIDRRPIAGRGLVLALAVAVAASLIWQVIALHFYWQVLPVYVAGLLLLLAAGPLQRRQSVLGGAAIGLCVLTIASLLVLPVFRLPAPDGPYAVGTTVVHLVDPHRLDATFPSGHREVMVQVWYPAASSRGPLAAYRRWKETTLLSTYDAVMDTHSHLDATVGRDTEGGRPFPLLLFNPAWQNPRTENTFQIEDLASHGFVVAAIDHTHNSMPVAFPDGQVVRSDETRPIDELGSYSEQEILTFAQGKIATHVADDLLTVDAFADWTRDPASRWYQRVDTDKVGTFGHSFGGAVAVAAAVADPRIRVALNMDGWMFGSVTGTEPGKPLFVMYEGRWPFDQAEVQEQRGSKIMEERLDVDDLDALMHALRTYGGYILAIDGTKHMNFSDRALYSPFRKLSSAGPSDPYYVHHIINQYSVAFFSHYLRGTTEPLLATGSRFPGTEMQEWLPAVSKK